MSTKPSPASRPDAPTPPMATDGSSWTARESLTRVLHRELVGPAGGHDELLPIKPDGRYLVGRIAPVRLTGAQGTAPSTDDPTDQRSADDDTIELGDEHDARDVRGLPVTNVDDSSVDADEDTGTEDTPIRRGLTIPASMGLRFQVAATCPTVTVTATWGTYSPEKVAVEVAPQGGTSPEPAQERRHYRRKHHQHAIPLRLADMASGRTHTLTVEESVALRVDITDDTELGRRIVEVALCNDLETPPTIPVHAWLYQTHLAVEADGQAEFLPVRDVLTDTRPDPDPEVQRLRLQYRDRLEFAIGRTCSVTWTTPEDDDDQRAAVKVETTWLPQAETPQVTAQSIDDALLDMRRLAEASPGALEAGLRPIADGYAEWLREQQELANGLPAHLRSTADEAIDEAWAVHAQLVDGIDFLVGDEEARRCFAFMNSVMAEQRVRSQIAQGRMGDAPADLDSITRAVHAKKASAHSWRAFQLAFVLMQLRSLSEPTSPRRSGPIPSVELLFFPTGGGKTEAYLGLAAYTFAVRRRQGAVESSDGPLDGTEGVAVLMRYTLRLLTAQQFQRATTLVCAAEVARRADTATWGEAAFRIGLWVGTDVTPKRVSEAAATVSDAQSGRAKRLPVLQFKRCPWCGHSIAPANVKVDEDAGRVFVRCGDRFGRCPFSEGGSVDEGLPVLTVDEEIYRLAPAFVIATVDKFARLAREGEAAALFGYVSQRCELHGFVHPDSQSCTIKLNNKHQQAKGGGRRLPHGRLRPPDLIIQDELHLITGALGTTVGLFEVVIDTLSTWRNAAGHAIKPLVVASSATVRNAPEQVRSLYGRAVTFFPPQVIDASETFFSTEIKPTQDSPGRRYLGVSTTGVRFTVAEIRLVETLLATGQLLFDAEPETADPYMTLVGYFSATRELAGLARYIQDDVQTALAKGRPGVDLPRRFGSAFGLHTAELTARVSGADITGTLDQMSLQFDPTYDTSQALAARIEDSRAGKKVARRRIHPYDVVLATSMLQVGVDVQRLGLMLVVGQPKNTAEYIQASSRVGRAADRPGLVVTLGNWSRPRDLAHFEQFRHYHETFYAQVEALSVTPFSVTAMERGLDGVLVSAARVLDAGLSAPATSLSPEAGAARVADRRPALEALIDTMTERVTAASDETSAKWARSRLINRLDTWEQRRTTLRDRSLSLTYEKVKDTSTHAPLLRSAENVTSRDALAGEAPFVVANSMREVQPEINLLVSPIKERLYYVAPPGAPVWAAQGKDRNP